MAEGGNGRQAMKCVHVSRYVRHWKRHFRAYQLEATDNVRTHRGIPLNQDRWLELLMIYRQYHKRTGGA